MSQRYGQRLADEILDELDKARKKHVQKFNSTHEGYAVIHEELDELWDEVKTQSGGDKAKLKKEAVQVAAMAIRFIQDLIEE